MNSDKQIQTEKIHQKLADLTETLDSEKIEVTPEVQRYIDENVRKVKEKLQAEEDIYPSDLKFIKKIKMWVEFEGKFTLEQIDSKQFKELLLLAKEVEKEISWIEEKFVIEGNKTVCGGSLYLRYCPGLTELPKGLEVGGALSLHVCPGLTELPKGLKVGEDLDLDGCTGLTELPEGLDVGGNLSLTDCTGLTELPERLEVEGSLYLKGCTGLAELPEGLKVEGDLDLDGCTGFTKLPEGLYVGDSLYLIGCSGFTELPEGLDVGGELDLTGCTGLTELPEGLTLEGDLILSSDLNKQVKADAERLQKAGKITKIRYA